MLQRDMDRAGGFVAQNGMALAERAALHVFAGQADGPCPRPGWTRGQRFGKWPNRPWWHQDRQTYHGGAQSARQLLLMVKFSGERSNSL